MPIHGKHKSVTSTDQWSRSRCFQSSRKYKGARTNWVILAYWDLFLHCMGLFSENSTAVILANTLSLLQRPGSVFLSENLTAVQLFLVQNKETHWLLLSPCFLKYSLNTVQHSCFPSTSATCWNWNLAMKTQKKIGLRLTPKKTPKPNLLIIWKICFSIQAEWAQDELLFWKWGWCDLSPVDFSVVLIFQLIFWSPSLYW